MRSLATKLLAASVMLASTTAIGFAESTPKSGGTLNYINQLIGGHFNTNIASGTPTGLPGVQLHCALLRFDRDWQPQSYLAKDWSVSDDGKAVTLSLVDNAKFHDGVPVTSEDVAFSIETIKANHPFKTMYEVVESVETPDPHTVVLNLSKPHPAILLAMSSQLGSVLPKHVYGGDDVDIRRHPNNAEGTVGCGPFKLTEFKPGDFIIMDRFDDYFIDGRPYLDRIVYRRMAESTSRVIAMEEGQADMYAWASDPIELNRLKRADHIDMTSQGYEAVGALQWLAFNLEREPFNDKRVRQAIAYAIDKDFILNAIMGGFSQRSLGPIHPGSIYAPEGVNPYDLDLDKANALLDEAGLLPDGDGIRFSAELDVIVNRGTFKRMAEYIKTQLRDVGIDVTIAVTPDIRAWIKKVSNHDFDMTIDSVFNWGDPVIGVHRTYQSDNIRPGVPWHNTQQYRNAELDALMEQASSETDVEKRSALYDEIQSMIVDDVPIAFMVTSPFHTVWNTERVGNPPIDSIWGTQVPWDNVYIKQ
ncbi:MAG: ABC transporter substrate-binding protein [Pseudomonadota bacterium]